MIDTSSLSQARYQQVSTAALNNPHEQLSLTAVAPQNGFVYIYLTNESALDLDVFFDDLKITHVEHPIVQEDHYYPFGLSMQGIGKQGSNPYKYNGFEEQDELDLGLYDYQARYYDPALGRFVSVDPTADLMRRHSPYNYAFDNPIRFTDPDGMMAEEGGKVDGEEVERNADIERDENGNIIRSNLNIGFGDRNRNRSNTNNSKDSKAFSNIEGFGDVSGGPGSGGNNGLVVGVGSGSAFQKTLAGENPYPIEDNRSLALGIFDGFGAGFDTTVDFLKSLTTREGWNDFGHGLNLAVLSCNTCPEGIAIRNQLADQAYSFAKSIPNMSSYQLGYNLGFISEKAVEVLITRNIYLDLE